MVSSAVAVEAQQDQVFPRPDLDPAKMPGHWLLARLGKKVLRPGGMGLTHKMLRAMNLGEQDEIVEFAPGMGVTAHLVLSTRHASYTAVERDAGAAKQVQRWLDRDITNGTPKKVITGQAQETGLPDCCATAVYGEAMLSMQTHTRKQQIIHEAFRLLKPGGRYAVHELSLYPDDLSEEIGTAISKDTTRAIHHQAIPLRRREWEALLQEAGFEVVYHATAPMKLLEPERLLMDEGLGGLIRFAWRLSRDKVARQRVKTMRRTFESHRNHMAAISFVARKPLG